MYPILVLTLLLIVGIGSRCSTWDEASTLLEDWKASGEASMEVVVTTESAVDYMKPLSAKELVKLKDSLTQALYYPLLSSLVNDLSTVKQCKTIHKCLHSKCTVLSAASPAICNYLSKDRFSANDFKCKNWPLPFRSLIRSLLDNNPTLAAIWSTRVARQQLEEAQAVDMMRTLSLLHPEAFDTLAFKKLWSPLVNLPPRFSPEAWNETLMTLAQEGAL
eukprot:Blabericola_migrator_1__2268@NODE_1627_length_4141_cov_279_934953_g1060_i0_p3_GENE_NODE_1627_length_4141_cov_279_934953_g1060_i0NODE_1627_length_4141_cov_279_934953_g1060_i0_p3_ORF_typecomplete_len219_score29_78_NODE_1627_length_4141_cov_279_934953_g1060_i014532109